MTIDKEDRSHKQSPKPQMKIHVLGVAGRENKSSSSSFATSSLDSL